MPTKEQIEAIIKSLQPILRLTNWEIDFDYCDKYRVKDLTGNEDVAVNSWDIKINYSHIHIRTDSNQTDEWYETLVHELFHLVTSDYRFHASSLLDYVDGDIAHTKESNMLSAYYEQLVENLAKIFCTVYPVTNFKHILEA
jgi:hypothetical protein